MFNPGKTLCNGFHSPRRLTSPCRRVVTRFFLARDAATRVLGDLSLLSPPPRSLAAMPDGLIDRVRCVSGTMGATGPYFGASSLPESYCRALGLHVTT